MKVETRYFASSGASSPALALQVTCLKDSYMLWIGVTEEAEENADRATVRGHLGKDWAVAMPPWKVRVYFFTTRRMELEQDGSDVYDKRSDTASNGNSVVAVIGFGFGAFYSDKTGCVGFSTGIWMNTTVDMRTAQRFGKQIYLSVDVPVSDDSRGILVKVEKALVETLQEIVRE
jgi:proteasome assembly chaperone 4